MHRCSATVYISAHVSPCVPTAPTPPPCLSPLRSQDVVVICGKGHEDYIDYGDGEGGVVRGWFDDRVEARNALSKLVYLDLLTKQGAVTRGMGMPWRDKYGD